MNSEGMNVPVIAVTANAYNNVPESLLAQRMDAYIAKPINVEQLRKVVSSAILKSENNT